MAKNIFYFHNTLILINLLLLQFLIIKLNLRVTSYRNAFPCFYFINVPAGSFKRKLVKKISRKSKTRNCLLRVSSRRALRRARRKH